MLHFKFSEAIQSLYAKKRVKHKVFNRWKWSRSVNALTYHSKRYSRPVTNQPGSPVCNRKSCFDESHLHNRCTPSQQPPVSYTPPEPEPMMTENMHLSFAERQRRISKVLCLYCGGGGHVITTCPNRPPRLWVSAIRHPPQNMQPLTILITLIVSNVSIPIHALLDSGSAGNFISGNLPPAQDPHHGQLQSLPSPIHNWKSTQPSWCQTHYGTYNTLHW